MKIRKKLAVASGLMIAVPVVVSLFLCIVILFYKGEGNLNRLKNLYEYDNGLLNVQTILYNYKDEVLTYEPVSEEEDGQDDEDEDDDDEEDDDDNDEKAEKLEKSRQKKSFGGMISDLSALGYYYQIQYNNRCVISNLPETAEDKIRELAGAEYEKIANFAVAKEKYSVVKRTYSDGIRQIEVLAYCDEYVQGSNQTSQVIREFLSVVWIFLIVLLTTIVCSIFLLSSWLSRGMKKSLDQLSEGVRQVQEGNLDYRIQSKKKDELGQACQEFDEMIDYLERSVEARVEYEEARKQMIAGISHDLRTPLTSIKAYVEGLSDGIANTEEKKRRYYDAIRIRVGDLEALVENLSLFSRFDREEYHYSMEKIEVKEFLDRFYHENEIEFLKNHIEWRKAPWPEVPLFIMGDKKQLKRVLGNLIDNTIKYREKEETVLVIEVEKQKDRLFLSLTDDGPGVPKEEQQKIFETFYRGDQARQNPGKGNGLGLAIIKEILKGHQADVSASEGLDKKGLKITMNFPLVS